MDMKKIANENLILKWRTGSHMYGTNGPESDEDFKGVCIPPKKFILGTSKFEQYEERTNSAGSGRRNTKEDIDLEIYSLPKFLHLLTENNPNIVELLFSPVNCLLFCNEYGKEILDNRNIFLSLRIKHKFSGYAYSQKHKITAGIETVKKLKEWGVTKEEHLNDEVLKNLGSLGLKTGGRLSLLLKYGYDTKFASHLIRLFLFGIELLKEGKLMLPASQNNYLVDIKNGKYTWPEILEKATQLEHLTEIAYLHSKLPQTPDFEAIENLQISMFERYWKETN